MNKRDVHIHIDALVLDGFMPGESAGVAEGLQQELHRLLKEAVPDSWRSEQAVPRVVAPSITLPSIRTPERIGTLIAESVYRAGAKDPAR